MSVGTTQNWCSKPNVKLYREKNKVGVYCHQFLMLVVCDQLFKAYGKSGIDGQGRPNALLLMAMTPRQF